MLCALLIGMAAGWAYFARSGVPDSPNGLPIAFMAADMARSMREGVPVPLWSPYALNGYGAPIAQFTPQGAAYAVAALEVLFTDTTADAFRLVMIVALTVTSGAMYALLMAWGIRWPLPATLIYMLSPFVGLTAPDVLGDLSLVLGHALLPMFWLFVTRALHPDTRAERFWVVLAVLTLGGMGLTVPLVSAGAWVGAAVSQMRRPGSAVLLLIGFGAVAVCAPLWMPMLWSTGQVYWLEPALPVTYPPQMAGFIGPVQAYSAVPQYTLGLLLPVLMVLGWVLRWRRAEHWALLPIGTGGVLAVWSAGMVWPTAQWLSLGSFYGALAAAGVFNWLWGQVRAHLRAQAEWVAAASVIALSLPVLALPARPLMKDFSVGAQWAYEQATGATPLLPAGHAVPSVMRSVPPLSSVMIADFDGSDPRTLNRVLPNTGLTVAIMAQAGYEHVWQISTDVARDLPVMVAYTPAWRATLDNQPLTIIRREDGLLAVRVPPAQNAQLRLTHTLTIEQRVPWGLVIGMALGLLIYVGRRWPFG